jgi:hypothetical protein
MSFRALALVPVTLVALVFAACGGNEPQPVGPTGPQGSATAPGTAASIAATGAPAAAVTAFRDAKGKEQQMAFMQGQVQGRMGKVFQAHDGKRYGDFSCKTCHGPNYVEPKAFLPKLTMKGGNITSFTEKPEVSKFMAEKIVPEMAAAMGEKPYDAATHTGFGCGGCHAIEMK